MTAVMPTVPPTRAQVDAALDAAQVHAVAAEQLQTEGRRQQRRYGRLTLILAAVVSMLVSFAGGIFSTVAYRAADDTRRVNVEQSAQVAELRDILARLQAQNDDLIARGWEPVPAPTTGDPTDALVALATSRVIAQLPPGPDAPTADEVAAVLRPTVLDSLTGPSRTEIAAQVAAYLGGQPTVAAIDAAVARRLAESPPPAGEPGATGDTGEPGATGAAGPRGEEGEKGDTGEMGPMGLEGPAGPAGPACPQGYSQQLVDIPTGPTILTCVPDNPEETP